MTILSDLGLEHRVDVRLHGRSFTMTLMDMLEKNDSPMFDFCYFDGGHTWDITGYAFLLVDKLLLPGAWFVFDVLDWKLSFLDPILFFFF